MRKYFNIDGKVIDHINHNGLDLRKENLRLCTIAENNRNQLKQKRNTSSKYKGVCWDKKNQKWFVSIKKKKKKSICVGHFISEEDAALAYDQVARFIWGEFAHPNFPDRFEEIVDINYIMNKKKEKTSNYIGVSKMKNKNKYSATITFKNRRIFIGNFTSELVAALAYDEVSKYLYKDSAKLNFSNEIDVILFETSDIEYIINKDIKPRSIYKGIKYNKHRETWTSKITVNGKAIYLGNYDNEYDAAMAYDNYIINNNLNRKTNF
jgi:hypothetical protein